MKRLALELGGNAAFLVFPTADLDLAVTIANLILRVEQKIYTYMGFGLFLGGWMHCQQVP